MRKDYPNEYRGDLSGYGVIWYTKKHILLIQEQAETRLDRLMEQMAEKKENVYSL